MFNLLKNKKNINSIKKENLMSVSNNVENQLQDLLNKDIEKINIDRLISLKTKIEVTKFLNNFDRLFLSTTIFGLIFICFIPEEEVIKYFFILIGIVFSGFLIIYKMIYPTLLKPKKILTI